MATIYLSKKDSDTLLKACNHLSDLQMDYEEGSYEHVEIENTYKNLMSIFYKNKNKRITKNSK